MMPIPKQYCLGIGIMCHYCGGVKSMGLDRVDNARGYTMDNVVPVCTVCNLMKKDMPPEEFVRASWAIVAKAAEDGVQARHAGGHRRIDDRRYETSLLPPCLVADVLRSPMARPRWRCVALLPRVHAQDCLLEERPLLTQTAACGMVDK